MTLSAVVAVMDHVKCVGGEIGLGVTMISKKPVESSAISAVAGLMALQS
jgi:hypothetical protein